MLNPGKELSDFQETWHPKVGLPYIELSPAMQKAKRRLGIKTVVVSPEGDTENHHARHVVTVVAKGTRTVMLRTKSGTPVRRSVTMPEFAQTKARLHLQAPERLPSPTKSGLGEPKTVSRVITLSMTMSPYLQLI